MKYFLFAKMVSPSFPSASNGADRVTMSQWSLNSSWERICYYPQYISGSGFFLCKAFQNFILNRIEKKVWSDIFWHRNCRAFAIWLNQYHLSCIYRRHTLFAGYLMGTQPLTLFLREFPLPWEILLSLFWFWNFSFFEK